MTAVMDAREIANEIARLEPLAEAERLARVAGIENLWEGSEKALATARAALEDSKCAERAGQFAQAVLAYRESCGRVRDGMREIAALDAKIAAFSEDDRTYFARANEIMRWTTNGFPQTRLSYTSATQFDARGNVLDVPPRDYQHIPVVPDDHWEAVKQLRELHIRRTREVGAATTNARNAIGDLARKWPALASIPQ